VRLIHAFALAAGSLLIFRIVVGRDEYLSATKTWRRMGEGVWTSGRRSRNQVSDASDV
jgi:hypothetical protein